MVCATYIFIIQSKLIFAIVIVPRFGAQKWIEAIIYTFHLAKKTIDNDLIKIINEVHILTIRLNFRIKIHTKFFEKQNF